jgi:hypothetical protein
MMLDSLQQQIIKKGSCYVEIDPRCSMDDDSLELWGRECGTCSKFSDTTFALGGGFSSRWSD